MLVSEFVPIKVVPRNKRRFPDWGFEHVSVGDVVNVPVANLSPQSTYFVDVQCDYCGKLFRCRLYSYRTHKARAFLDTDCCQDCKQLKIEETMMAKYGVKSSLSLPEVQEKIKASCLAKYGVEYPMFCDDFQEKTEATMLRKYGVKHNMQSAELREKLHSTLLQRYGVEHALQYPPFLDKALQKSHTIGISAPQREIFEKVNNLGYPCELNYYTGRFFYDVAVFCADNKIDVEYDGYWWHKDRIDKDRERDAIAVEEGWKVIRFRPIERYNDAPTQEQIQNAINTVINENRSVLWIELGGLTI